MKGAKKNIVVAALFTRVNRFRILDSKLENNKPIE